MYKTKRLLLILTCLSLGLSGCFNPSSSSGETSVTSPSESEIISETSSESSSGDLPPSSVEELSFPRVIFEVTSPIEVPSNAAIKVAGNFNGWSPYYSEVVLSHKTGKIYTATIDFADTEINQVIEYKYVLLYDDQTTDNQWRYVEGDQHRGEIANRSYKLQAGSFLLRETIQSFKDVDPGVSTLTRGSLDIVTLTMTQFADHRERKIRIWLPDGYNANNKSKKYPVLYMFDGQNLFDGTTAYAGEWEIDESIGKMMDEGYGGTIVVGIDNGPERWDEYSPSIFSIKDENKGNFNTPSGEKTGAFVVETVKPYVDAHYNTLTDNQHTGVGGSSMGGIMTFFMAINYPEVFGYALPFSSSHWIYVDGHIENFINAKVTGDVSRFSRLYLWNGSLETERLQYPGIIKNALLAKGYNEAKIKIVTTQGGGHNEASWLQAFPNAYRWLVNF